MLSRYLSGLALVMMFGYSCTAISQTANRAGAFEKPLDTRFYVAPMASYGIFDDDVSSQGNLLDLDDGFGGHLAIGKPLTHWLNLELQAFYFDSIDEERSNTELDIFGYGASALLFPFRSRFPIFGILGYSYGEYDFADGEPNADLFDIGVGYVQPVNDYGIAIRGEYRYRIADLDGRNFDADFDDHIIQLGVQIPIGPAPKAAPPPKPKPVSRPGPRPKPVPVAPADSDGDGVPDNRDQCPGTPAGVRVDANGCPIEKAQPIVLKGVTFEYDSAKLTANAEQRLDNVVNALSSSSNLNVRVEGHTDSIGSASYNQDLSQRRANSVKSYLVDHGVAPGRLRTRGFGETRPVAPNTKANGSDNPAGRAKNRRVELHVIK